jgi:Glycine-zipper domain
MKRAWVGFFLGVLVQVGTAQSSQQNAPATGTNQASVAQSVGLFVYPKNHQTPEQQSTDESQCFASAKQQTGIDPFAPPPSTSEAAKTTQGGAVKGSGKGAAGGAAIGAIAGDAGTGAAVGATAGAIHGRRAQKKAQQQAEQQAQASTQQQQAQATDTFKRAMSACLDAKGYSVK